MYNFLRKLFRHLTFDIEIRDREREGGMNENILMVSCTIYSFSQTLLV